MPAQAPNGCCQDLWSFDLFYDVSKFRDYQELALKPFDAQPTAGLVSVEILAPKSLYDGYEELTVTMDDEVRKHWENKWVHHLRMLTSTISQQGAQQALQELHRAAFKINQVPVETLRFELMAIN